MDAHLQMIPQNGKKNFALESKNFLVNHLTLAQIFCKTLNFIFPQPPNNES